MRKYLMVSGVGSALFTAVISASALLPGVASAQAVGNVVSSTPVLKRVTEPRNACVNDADGRQTCRTEMVTEDRLIGYKVVYEYAGKQHQVQLPFAVGATIPLEISGDSVSPAPTPSVALSAPQPTYERRGPVVVERVVREPVYVGDDYYAGSYYPYPYSYYSPLAPIIGLGLAWGVGYYGGYFRGGYYNPGIRHWRRR